MFPMTVKKQSGRAPSSSGGKDYHLILIVTADGRALYINRWGKAHQWGNGWLCEYYPSAFNALAAYEKKHREKLEREYREHFIDSEKVANNEAELRKILGPQYVKAIGAPNWAQLVPGADVTGMKDGQHVAEWDEAAQRYKGRPRKLVEEVPEPPAPVEERVASNPNWGIWG